MRHFTRWFLMAMLLPAMAPMMAAEQAVTQESEGGGQSARLAIQRALETKGDFEFVEAPLEEVIEFLRQRHGINIVFDKLALDDAGVGSDTFVTRSLSGVSLRSALRLMLRELQLTYDVSDEVLLITTPEESEKRLKTVVYNVADLVRQKYEYGETTYDDDWLIDVVMANINPESWDEEGGPGSIRSLHGRSLVVSQTGEVQEQISSLFATMRRIRDLQTKSAELDVYYPVQPAGSNEIAIGRALDQAAQLEFIDAPILDVAEFLSEKYGIEVQFDNLALDDAGVGGDTPVTANLKNMSLRSALALLLRELQLEFLIQDEVLLITTPEEEEDRLDVGIYPVADLLRAPGAGSDVRPDFDSLIAIIVDTVAPESWSDVGGPGNIRQLPVLDALVFSQTADVHRQIASLLTDLRAARREQTGEEKERTDDAVEQDRDDELSLRFYPLLSHDSDDQGKEVIRLLMTAVEPRSWNPAEGRFLMFVRGRLVVKQTGNVHREIGKLLEKLGVWSPNISIKPDGFNWRGSGRGGGFGGGGQGGGMFRVPQ